MDKTSAASPEKPVNPKATVTIGGRKLTFWQFMGTFLFTYGLIGALILIYSPAGLVVAAIIGYPSIFFFTAGLAVFALQRPGVALIVGAFMAALHILLLYYFDVEAGVFWLLLSEEGDHLIRQITGF